MYSIYKITNIINNKLYIGFSNNPNNRFKEHTRLLLKNKHHSHKLQNAFNKYGLENFKFEIIKSNINQENIEKQEIDYISEYNSYDRGYNCTKGGNINMVCTKYWKGKFGKNHNIAKKVYQYDLDGNYIQEWGSVIDAARFFGTEFSGLISKSCYKNKYSAYKYYWRHEYKGEKIEIEERVYYQERPVIMICPITNKELQTFPNSKIVEEFLKTGKNKIHNVCRGQRKHWAGYKWKYA